MKCLSIAFALLFAALTALAPAADRTTLDLGWKFHLGNAADPSKDFGYGTGSIYAKSGQGVGPIRPGFDDSTWRTVDVPHDWAIELPFIPNTPALVGRGSKPLGGRYPETSIGWYRKSFSVPTSPDAAKRRYRIDFDGVYRDCRVWLNGHFLGQHESGYSGFAYDVSDWINFTGQNILTVRVDATQGEGWFYEGAGIYRHVWLTVSNPVHIARHGVYVIPTVKDDTGRLKVFVAVQNDSDKAAKVLLGFNLTTPSGAKLDDMDLVAMPVVDNSAMTLKRVDAKADVVAPRSSRVFMRILTVHQVELWSIEHPNLYSLTVDINSRSLKSPVVLATDDRKRVSLGFRTIRFDKDKGFFLNGKHVEIKGTCNHQDHAGVGSAVPDAVNEYRIRCLKAMGSNAYRTSHNDPTPSILDACDKLGMVVMDEHRLMDSAPDTLAQLRELVRRDRNHPCVIMWSIGNEEPILGTEIGHRIALTMKRTIHKLDSTRPITCAANNGNGFEGVNEVMDLRGWNYVAGGNTDDYHRDHPQQPIYGSEEASTLSTRGIYTNDPDAGYVSAYDVNKPGWGSLAEWWWKYYMKRPFLAGAFVWTGFDYRGEPTPYGWPCISSHFGIMDTCGFPKDNYYYYQAQWTDQPVLHLLPHWNWAGLEGKEIEVWAQTNCDSVELFLNGVSQGVRAVEKYGHAMWKVKYAPGTLEAKGYRAGALVKTEVVKTAGAPAKLVLTPYRSTMAADGEDADVFNISVVDKDGIPVPTANNRLDFDIDGPARIIGVGNGNPSDHDPDTYVSVPQGIAISDWKMAPAANDAPTGDTLSVKPTGDARPVRVTAEPYQIREPNTSAVFSADFEVTQDQLDRGIDALNIGAIDDEGWVYVNDHLVGHANDWSATFRFEVARFLKAGKNSITIYVRNRGGRGGVGGGVGLAGPDIQPKFSRRLFNGLAQVIVRAGTKPGSVRLSVTCKGLEPATTTVQTNPSTP
ncbi:MAG: beta-galactosidase GalA [Fimbriimonadaceae bacterium]